MKCKCFCCILNVYASVYVHFQCVLFCVHGARLLGMLAVSRVFLPIEGWGRDNLPHLSENWLPMNDLVRLQTALRSIAERASDLGVLLVDYS